jgi:prevent-host-death family protein
MSAVLDPSLAADPTPAAFAEALARAEHDKGRTVVTREGRPVAVLVPIEDLEALDALEDARDAEAVREGLAEYDRDGANWPAYTAEELAARWGIDPVDPTRP